MSWETIALGYVTYLAVVAASVRRFHRARRPTLVAAFGAWTVWAMARGAPRSLPIEILVPAACLLAGYWLSGLFFIAPMARVEQWLLRIDQRGGVGRGACPWILLEYLELAYVLVYAVVPAGAITLALGGHADAVPRFWSVVLLAEFISYGLLPWVQTRPPRAIEMPPQAASPPVSMVRRFNLAVLGRASIQANTLPSGHAAGAVATALAVTSIMPTAGAAFVILAASIVIATVVGRYHYIVDSLLGVIVAAGAWYLLAHG
jgi:membrane-associated phospholipid phosphatase